MSEEQKPNLPILHYPEHDVFPSLYRESLDALRSLVDSEKTHGRRYSAVTEAYVDMLKQALHASVTVMNMSPAPSKLAVPSPSSKEHKENKMKQDNDGEDEFQKEILHKFQNLSLIDVKRTGNMWKDLEELKDLTAENQRHLLLHWVHRGALGLLLHFQKIRDYHFIHIVTKNLASDELMDLVRTVHATGQLHMELYILSKLPNFPDPLYRANIIRLLCSEMNTDNSMQAVIKYVQQKDPDAELLYSTDIVNALLPDKSFLVPDMNYIDTDDDGDIFSLISYESDDEEEEEDDDDTSKSKTKDFWDKAKEFHRENEETQKGLRDLAMAGRLTKLYCALYELKTYDVMFSLHRLVRMGNSGVITHATDHSQWHILLLLARLCGYTKETSLLELLPSADECLRRIKQTVNVKDTMEALQDYLATADSDWNREHDNSQRVLNLLADCAHESDDDDEYHHDTDQMSEAFRSRFMQSPSEIEEEEPEKEEESTITVFKWTENFWSKSLQDIMALDSTFWAGMKEASYNDLFFTLLDLVTKYKLSVLDYIQSTQQIDIVGAVFSHASDNHIGLLTKKLLKPERLHLCLYIKLLLCEPYSNLLPSKTILLEKLRECYYDDGSILLQASLLVYTMKHDSDYPVWISSPHCLSSVTSNCK